MDDWQKDWLKQIEKASAEFEGFLVDVGETTEFFLNEVSENTESLLDEVSENFDSFFGQFQLDFTEEVDSLVKDLVDLFIYTGEELDIILREDWQDFSDDNFTQVSYHAPSAEKNPACINCANYHGQSYNGNLLVCAMHPSGYEENSCPDWVEN